MVLWSVVGLDSHGLLSVFAAKTQIEMKPGGCNAYITEMKTSKKGMDVFVFVNLGI